MMSRAAILLILLLTGCPSSARATCELYDIPPHDFTCIVMATALASGAVDSSRQSAVESAILLECYEWQRRRQECESKSNILPF